MTRHTDEDLDRAAKRVEEFLEDLERIVTASEAVRASEVALLEAVDTARTHGCSWNAIAQALGVTRQAARQRFGHKTSA